MKPAKKAPPPALEKPRQPGRIRAVFLAVAVHAAFFALIVFGVTWQSRPEVPVQAELWDKLPPAPVKAAPKPPEPEPAPPEEPPKPEPAKTAPKPPEEKPQPPKPDPAIAKKLEREKRDTEKKEKVEREKAQKQKDDEAKKKREEEARRKEDERARAEAQKARELAAAAQKSEIDRFINDIKNKRQSHV